MAFLNYFDHHDRKKTRSHLKDLVRVALADEILKDEEKQFLERVATNAGIGPEELKEIIDEVTHIEFIPPTELDQKFEQLFNIARLIMIDDHIHEKEIEYCIHFGHTLNFDDQFTKKLIAELEEDPKADGDDMFEKLLKK